MLKACLLYTSPVDDDFKEGGLKFVDEVKGGNIPKEFIPSVQKGFTTAMKKDVYKRQVRTCWLLTCRGRAITMRMLSY